MTTSNLPVNAKRKSALIASTAIPGQHKSGRPQRVSVKAAHRRNLPKNLKQISYEALAEDPIYRRIARAGDDGTDSPHWDARASRRY